MTKTEMTMREFLNEVLALAEEGTKVHDKAVAELAKIDASNAKARTTESKAMKENKPLIDALVGGILTADADKLTTEIAVALGVNTSKAGACLRHLENTGAVKSIDVKVKGKGTQKGWRLA